MTDNEIIKVWAKCLTDNEDCSKCPLLGIGCHEQILDILNRLQSENENYSHNVRTMTNSIREYQKAIENYKQIAENQQSVSMDKEVEIKRLKAEVEGLQAEIGIKNLTIQGLEQERILHNETIAEELELVKAEAAKEFAHKIESYKTGIFIKGEELIILPLCDFEDIKSEMVGEDK